LRNKFLSGLYYRKKCKEVCKNSIHCVKKCKFEQLVAVYVFSKPFLYSTFFYLFAGSVESAFAGFALGLLGMLAWVIHDTFGKETKVLNRLLGNMV
jgi:hypothetical protein